MTRILLYIISCMCYFNVYSQNSLKNFVYNESVDLDIFSKDDSLYLQMNKLDSIFNNKKIVLIGEQSHGDASTFYSKEFIIKYLYSKHKFNLLVFESDFFSLSFINKIANQISVDSINKLIHLNIHKEWAACSALDSFFYKFVSYNLKTNPKFKVLGCDPQFHGQISKDYFCKEFNNYIKSLHLPNYESNKIDSLTVMIDSAFFLEHHKDKLIEKMSKITYFIQELEIGLKKSNIKVDSFWLYCINNLKSTAISTLAFYSNKYKNIDRDRQMARNLLWLSRTKNDKDKMIVWSANSHISKSLSEINKSYKSTGEYLKEDSYFYDNSYFIGVTSLKGETHNMYYDTRYQVDKAKRNGFENWIPTDYNFAFIDFSKLKKYNTEIVRKKFNMKGFGHTNKRFSWIKSFDGVLYIKQMNPCE